MSGDERAHGARDGLSAAKRALLEQRLRGTGPIELAQATPPTEARAAGAPLPLSHGQRRLWFLHQLAPHSAAYNMAQAFRLEGELDVAALEGSIGAITVRHEVLRTVFEERDGQPAARLAAASGPALERVDLSAVDAATREREVRALLAVEARAPFDLRTGPLLRGLLLRLAPTEHVLAITLHHIACDEWSLEAFWRELAQHYRAFREQRPVLLRPLALQYAEHAAWQNARLEAGGFNGQLAWWQERLRGAPPSLELPADRARPPRQSFRGGLESSTLPAELADALRALARREDATPFMLMLAAFATLLHRYSGASDIVVGAPLTGRTRPELEESIGFFINSVVLRVDLSGDPPFRELLRRARDTVLDAFAHQEAPFELIVERLRPDRRAAHNPLFQVMLVPQRETAPPALGPELRALPVPIETGAAKLDLTLFVSEAAGRPLEATIEYAADLFDRDTVRRTLEHLRVLLDGIAAAPDRAVSRLPLLPEDERRRVLSEWNATGDVRGNGQRADALFEAAAARAPDRVAIVTDHGLLTYRELNAQAASVAARLRAMGVGPGVCVGLCATRSPALLTGIFGILKAGGAYVPLDPEYPDARLRFALEATRAPVVLAERALAGRVPHGGGSVVWIDDGEPAAHTPAVPARATADDVAYVIFTSGSTGAPKGVPITHRNLVHSTLARADHYGAGPDRFLLLSSFAFDSSVAGIFWTLCTGGTLVLPPPRAEQDAHALAVSIARHGVTHTLCLPTLWAALLEHAPPRLLDSITTAIVAGEPCAPAVVARHSEVLPGAALHNEYGPTEATVWSTVYRVPPDFTGTRVPIGQPIAGTRAYVLDANGEPVPIGVPGELYIGGAGVARGYLDRPDETAARFVRDRFGGDPDGRLYRTGDRARWRADGNLEFIGRLDRQLKVRGHRIEPDEIEAALRELAFVADAAVTARARENTAQAPDTDAVVAALCALERDAAERTLREVEHEAAADART